MDGVAGPARVSLPELSLRTSPATVLCRRLIGALQKIGMGRVCRLLYDDRAWARQPPARKLSAMHARLSMWWPADPAATPTRA